MSSDPPRYEGLKPVMVIEGGQAKVNVPSADMDSWLICLICLQEHL
jgi:hypothetical protein